MISFLWTQTGAIPFQFIDECYVLRIHSPFYVWIWTEQGELRKSQMFPSSGAIFKSTNIMTMSKSELSKTLTVELIVVKCEDRQTDRRTYRRADGRTDRQTEWTVYDNVAKTFQEWKNWGKKSKTIICTMTNDCLCIDF